MPWDTDRSSGFLTHFAGTVKESYFGTNPKYMDGDALLLCLELDEVEVLEEGYEGDVPDPLTVEIPCGGKDWFTEDGTVAEHKKNKDRFHTSGWMGKLVDAVISSQTDYDGPATANYGGNTERTDGEPLDVDFADLYQVLESRGDPTEAAIYEGLRFEFAELQADFGPDREAQKKGDKDARISSRRTLPIRYFPAEAAKPASKARGATKKAAAKPATKSKAQEAKERAAAKRAEATTTVNGEANPFVDIAEDLDTAEALMAALKANDDYDAFVEACLQIEAVEKNDALLDAVIDENGPWASRDELVG